MIDKIMGSDKLYKDNNNTTITNYFKFHFHKQSLGCYPMGWQSCCYSCLHDGSTSHKLFTWELTHVLCGCGCACVYMEEELTHSHKITWVLSYYIPVLKYYHQEFNWDRYGIVCRQLGTQYVSIILLFRGCLHIEVYGEWSGLSELSIILWVFAVEECSLSRVLLYTLLLCTLLLRTLRKTSGSITPFLSASPR